MNRDSALSWRQLHWVQPVNDALALSLLQHLAADSTRPSVVLEARGADRLVHHFVASEPGYLPRLAQLFEAHTGASLTSKPPSRELFETNTRLRVRQQALPLATERLPTAVRGVFAALAAAGRGEHLTLQITLGQGIAPRSLGGRPTEPSSGLAQLLSGPRPAASDSAHRMRHKADQPGFRATVRLSASSGNPARERQLIDGLLSALRTLQAAGTSLSLVREPAGRARTPKRPGAWSLRLGADEILALVGWPIDAERLPGMPAQHPKLLSLPAGKQDATRPFATGTHPASASTVGISISDALVHTAVVGPTGSGKSTVLLNLILADLKAGRSVVVIDPKADLARDVLAMAPKDRLDDIIVLDPTHDRPVGINPLQRAPGVPAELVADSILTVFRELFPTLFGPRVADVLYSSLLALARTDGATLAWLPRLLGDAKARAGILSRLTLTEDEADFWEAWARMSQRQQAQFAGPVLSRLRQYLNRPSLRRVLDQAEPRFNLAHIFDKRRVLIVPLNSALLGADVSRLLGALLVSRLWDLTLSRTLVEPAKRTPVSIFIDEAAQFVKLGDLSEALAMSRSYGTAWTLAFQYRDQFSTEARAAVDSNALNTVVFGLGIKDAREYAAMVPDLTPEDFTSLGMHEIYVQIVRDGHRAGWASARTLPPPKAVNDPDEITSRSQARWGGEAATDPRPVESEPAVEATPSRPELPRPPIGRKKRSES